MAGTSGWSFVLDEPTRVLIADDDPIFCEFACVHLSTPVATIVTVGDGEAAWQALQDGDYDLALLDIEMPKVDGFELLSRIRATGRLSSLPCVMVTGREDIASIDRAYELGSTAFVTKPVNWRQLSYQLRHVLRTARNERRLRLERDGALEATALPAAGGQEIAASVERILEISEWLQREAGIGKAGDIAREAREVLTRLSGSQGEPQLGAAALLSKAG